MLSVIIVFLLPTRWSHSLTPLYLFYSLIFVFTFLLWYCYAPGGIIILKMNCVEERCCPFTHKTANSNGVLTPNIAKCHTRGLYPIQPSRNKIKPFYQKSLFSASYLDNLNSLTSYKFSIKELYREITNLIIKCEFLCQCSN